MRSLTKLIVLFFIVFVFIPKGYSQQNADPGIGILMSPGSLLQNSTGILSATVGNYGNTTIVSNSLRVTISVGTDAEILGIAGGSDTRWSQLTLTTGSANTIRLTNTGGGFNSFDVGDILLIVRGNIVSSHDIILGNIVYIVASNSLLCGGCASPPLNTLQGNASNLNDNSQTSLAVTCGLIPAPFAGSLTQPTCSTSAGSFQIIGYDTSNTYNFTPTVLSTSVTGLVSANPNTYTFKLTNSLGCISVQSTNLTINSQPATTTSTTNDTICSNILPYLWNGINRTIEGIYTFNTTNSVGCDSTATLNLTVNPVITPTSSPVSINLGLDATVMVTAAVSPAGGTIVWNNGNPLTATSYTYNIVGICGNTFCTNSIVRISSCSKPNAGADLFTCTGTTLNLIGTSTNTGNWLAMTGNPSGAILGATTLGEAELNFTSNSIGTFAFIYTVLAGCADTVNVFVGNPIANFTYSKNCKNEVTFINNSVNATDFEWIIGDKTICTTSTIPNQTLHSDNASSGTSYMVTLIAKNNSICYDTFTQMITIYPPAITVFSTTPLGCSTKVNFNNFTKFGSSYSWDFGVIGLTTDTSSQTNPTYTYPSNGTYTVSLIANNVEGCGDTLTKTVVVNSNGIVPTANFTINDISNACAKRNSFTNTSNNAISYQWIFVDGSIVNTVNAAKSFAYAGTYAVKLIAQSSTSCFDTITQNVNVIGNSIGAVASFGVNNRKQCLANNSFEFYNTSTFIGSGWIPTYNWDFGDGTYDNVNSSVFNKHYTNPGINTVRVIAIGSNGCRDTAYQTIEVLPSPVAAFTASTSCGMTALINNQTTGAISNIWNFGTSYYEENNAATFSNTYHHENWYFITLTTIGANGCTDITDRGVFPTRVGAPAPNFTYDTLSCSHAIRFTNTSIGGASASWNFGDGSPLNTNFDPTHVYATAGNYTVNLTLNNGPFCSASYSLLVHAPQGYNLATPKVGMTLNITACSNTINGVDTSLNTSSSKWYFDGILYSNSSLFTYPNPPIGGHELMLVTSNGICSDTMKKFVLIQAAPISKVTHQLSSCSRTVLFSSEATNGNTYQWNFNDLGATQNTSEGSLVSHTFSTNGTYYVSLTSTNLTGCTSSTIDTVIVNAGNNPLNAAFKFNSNTCNCVCNNKIQFINLSSGIGNTYLWNFGDGTSTTQANPNKGFAEAGTYNVTLTAISPSGCISVASMQVSILPSAKGPSASFNTDNQIQCLSGNNFSFYNTSKHMGSGWNMKYYWNFGDGTIDTVNTFVFNKHYNAVGIYTVSLVALGSDNCFDTMTMTVQVKSNNCMSYSNTVQVFNQTNNGSLIVASGNANTGITEQVINNNSWNLYPNPNKGNFSVACNKLSNNVDIEVIDILGRKVNANFTKNYAENKVEITCTNISTGYYFVIINNGKDGENTRLKFNITE